jgi:fatty-acyl-CoA synthase
VRWELDWIESRARLTPNATAVVDGEDHEAWSYKDLNDRAEKVASWLLNEGVRKGERVVLISPNHISYFDLLFACGKVGAVFTPLNWRLSLEEINFILEDCTPSVVCYHPIFEELVENLHPCFQQVPISQLYSANGQPISIELLDEDPLAMIYTGGTTGRPKGVVLTHQSILWNGINTIVSWNLTNDDTTLTYLPMFHTGGLNALSIPLLMAGGKVIIGSNFEPVQAIRIINDFQCTIVLFVPTMYHMLVETTEFRQAQFPSMNTFLSGGAPCPLEIYDAFHQKGLMFKEGYGLTEAGPNNFFIDPIEAQKKLGSVGKPMLFNSIKLVKKDGAEALIGEVGEVLIQGKHAFQSYWNNENATNAAIKQGWLYTGDLARRDEDGYYYIVGRKKDMIITGGENVYPLEVEHWISTHPHINEVAVIGMPHAKWGEVVTAFIVLKKGATITSNEIKAHCQYKLGNYKIPKSFIFLDELPKTHVGKIDKKELRIIGEMNGIK